MIGKPEESRASGAQDACIRPRGTGPLAAHWRCSVCSAPSLGRLASQNLGPLALSFA